MAILQGFCGDSYESSALVSIAAMSMNCYPEPMPQGAKSPMTLFACPGVVLGVDVSSIAQPGRGMFCVSNVGALPDRLFVAEGNTLYEVDADWTVHVRATIATDTYPASFATNGVSGNQLMVASGGVLYNYDLPTNVVTPIALFMGASVPIRQVAFMSGFFVALDAVHSEFYLSALDNGTSWDLTQVAPRSEASDPWVSLTVVLTQNLLFLQGSRTSEFWYNAGAPVFPFAPVQGGLIQQGTVAPFSSQVLDSAVLWLSQNQNGNAQVFQTNGYLPTRVSTDAVEQALQGYGDLSGAVAFTYQDQGHTFYVLTVPGQGTWAYDTSTSLWHQRGLWNSAQVRYDAYRPQYHAWAFGKHVVADGATGKLFELNTAFFNDVDGNPLRWERRSPCTFGDGLNTVFYRALQIDMQTGVGASGGALPQAELSWSDDGGQTYPVATTQPIGALGATQTRVIFQMLGASRARIWRLVIYASVVKRVLQAVFRPDPVTGTS